MNMLEWKHALIAERLRELQEAKIEAFSVGTLYYSLPQHQHIRDLLHEVICVLQEVLRVNA